MKRLLLRCAIGLLLLPLIPAKAPVRQNVQRKRFRQTRPWVRLAV